MYELQNAIEILLFIYKYVNLLPQDIFQDCSLFNTVLDHSDWRVQFLLHVNQSVYLALGGYICPSALLLSGKHCMRLIPHALVLHLCYHPEDGLGGCSML